MTEPEVIQNILIRLKPYFEIKREVYDVTGKNRIDTILKLNDMEIYLGVEFKKQDKKKGEFMGKYLSQAIRYSQTKFKINSTVIKIPIFICPPLSYNYLIAPDKNSKIIINGNEYFKDRHEKNHAHHTVNGLLGSFGLGELRTLTISTDQYLRFVFSNRCIWNNAPKWDDKDQINGLHEKNYEILMRTICR